MTNQEILQKLGEVKKGRYINFTKIKDLGSGIVKESDMVIRLGINYANMKINENKQTGQLPWGRWVEGLENLVVEHKGKYYLRITSTDPSYPESGADVIATRYLRNGQEISKEEVIYMIGETKTSSKASPVYNVKFENIVKLGK
ncbi:MAG: hypothetical protein PHI22_04640 [Bacilli bacterium]|nr:hypothetical protein [Bacilli bacterium]MDD4643718.1 hypothetical protein [Bacilli bacterium]